MKVCSPVAHPPNHDIRVQHPTVGRNTEAHPSRRADVHCKGDRALCSAEVPVEHVRISTSVVEGPIKGVPAGEVTENKGEESQETQQRLHCCCLRIDKGLETRAIFFGSLRSALRLVVISSYPALEQRVTQFTRDPDLFTHIMPGIEDIQVQMFCIHFLTELKAFKAELIQKS